MKARNHKHTQTCKPPQHSTKYSFSESQEALAWAQTCTKTGNLFSSKWQGTRMKYTVYSYVPPDNLLHTQPTASPVNSLWPSDSSWHHRYWSTLVDVMAYWLMAPPHYLNVDLSPGDVSYKSHNALDKYPIMHHFVIEMCTFLLQNCALWDMGLEHCGICATGLSPGIHFKENLMEFQTFSWRTCILKMLSQNVSHFVQASACSEF